MRDGQRSHILQPQVHVRPDLTGQRHPHYPGQPRDRAGDPVGYLAGVGHAGQVDRHIPHDRGGHPMPLPDHRPVPRDRDQNRRPLTRLPEGQRVRVPRICICGSIPGSVEMPDQRVMQPCGLDLLRNGACGTFPSSWNASAPCSEPWNKARFTPPRSTPNPSRKPLVCAGRPVACTPQCQPVVKLNRR